MNQQNAANQGNNQNTQEYLTVYFVIFDGQNQEIAIQCTFTEKVAVVIDRYRAKTGDNDMTDKFVFNTKNVCPELKVA